MAKAKFSVEEWGKMKQLPGFPKIDHFVDKDGEKYQVHEIEEDDPGYDSEVNYAENIWFTVLMDGTLNFMFDDGSGITGELVPVIKK